jgi:Glucodextranase, domain N
MADAPIMFAPGWPGIPARWTSSARSGLGTATSLDSRVWFALSHGILNEIYYPRVDHACTRDLGFIVTDGKTYFSEEKRDARSETAPMAPGVPAYRIHNTAVDGRYRIEKEVWTDPWRDVVLQRVRFVPLQGRLADFRLHVVLAPHLANRGGGNTAWVGDYKGTPMLFAERENHALALASTTPWVLRSVGVVGFVHRPRLRLRDAAGVGPRRVPQFVPVTSRRGELRLPAATHAALPGQQGHVTPYLLALQQRDPLDAARQNPPDRDARPGDRALERG